MVGGVVERRSGVRIFLNFFFWFLLHLFSAHSLKLKSLNAFLFTALSFVLSLCIVLYLYNRIHWAATMLSPGISSTGTKRRS